MGSPGFGPRPGPYPSNAFPGPRPGFPGPRHPSSSAGPLPPQSPSTSAPVPSHLAGPPRPMVPPQRPHVSLGQEPQHEQVRVKLVNLIWCIIWHFKKKSDILSDTFEVLCFDILKKNLWIIKQGEIFIWWYYPSAQFIGYNPIHGSADRPGLIGLGPWIPIYPWSNMVGPLNKMKFQPRKPNRPRMHFPPDTVEALEPAMYNRVTARNARMEIDFWKQVMMPLKSGLVSEVRTSNPTPGVSV